MALVQIPIPGPTEAENLSAQRPDLFAPGQAFITQNDTGAWFILCPEEIKPDIEALDKSDARTRLSAYAGLKRWLTETAGINSTGSPSKPIKTDADSQRKVATLNADFRNSYITGTVEFKLADGTFVVANAAMIDGFYRDIQNHIKACYDAEQAAFNAVQNGTATTNADVDAFFAGIPILPAGTVSLTIGARRA